jgi:hypothetical protein
MSQINDNIACAFSGLSAESGSTCFAHSSVRWDPLQVFYGMQVPPLLTWWT